MTVSMFRRVPVLAAIVVALAALLAACGGGNDQRAASDVQEITIEAHDIGFAPVNFTVEAGKPVRLTLVNTGALEHDVTIPGMNATDDIIEAPGDSGMSGMSHHMMGNMMPGTVHMAAHGGERVTVQFTPRAGMFQFYCSVPGHMDAGMVGTVDVT